MQSNDASMMLATTSQEKQTDSCTEDSGLPLSPTPMLPSVEIDETRDPMRIKCRDMLAAALRGPRKSFVESYSLCRDIAPSLRGGRCSCVNLVTYLGH